ncbi:hypothetical protein QBC47DRAFT_351615 [Echria macrotheca]|uniref:Uncharacterized protein n=1 Tax=Echria macrotheca TaxID=438768 RepID=A0AAJ0B4F1_9PEZI|nr:hypothetical protein QBC47DRAFT_351615 [Echria macrotheca]
MDRRRSALTPESYARAIISLSRRYSSTSVFPGNNYVGIAEWLLQDRALLSTTKADEDITLFASASEQPHDLVVVYNSAERKWDVQSFSQDQYDDFSVSSSATAGGMGQMVFIRGFISPSWLSALGSRYNIDPEFFRRHMDFLSASVDRHAFSFPSLATSSNNIFRLCVSTILHRDDFSSQDLRSQRSEQMAELATYKIQQLRSTKIRCGDSLVRQYSTVCSRFSVLEQWISVCIARTDRGWAVIAWMDQGRPLEHSPPGPWTNHIESKAIPLPILQHHQKMAFRTTVNRLDADANASAQVQQSTAILPLQYDSLVALTDLARRAPQDPLSMSIPLFAHAAFSEVQFLNLMESRIQEQIGAITEDVPADALGTLQHFSNILNRHAHQLNDSTRAFCKLMERGNQGNSQSSSGPESPMWRGAGPGLGPHLRQPSPSPDDMPRTSTADGVYSPKGLLESYEELQVRCVELSKMCTRGITLAMNKATIEESRKAIEQSARVKKLTLLATLFIPLSFSSSLFGMNIDLLGQGTVEFWWFFVWCIPITLSTYMMYLWDFQKLRRHWIDLWHWLRHVRRDKGEKDPSHVV